MFETTPVGFLWLWPHLSYPCVLSFRTRDISLDRRFQTAYCLLPTVLSQTSAMFGKGLWGGSILSSVFGAGMTGFRMAGAPSYTKITSSSGSRFVLACARKLSKRAALILLRAAEENTSLLIGEIAIVIVKFRPRRILDGTPSLPAALYRGFWPSKYCSRIRRQTHSGALRHGS